jgi:hypothetical protein
VKLLTKDILKKLPKIGSTSELESKDVKVPLKLFGGGSWTWYVTEFDGTDEMFGYVKGLDNELGYFSYKELATAKFPPFGLPVERDKFWDPNTTLEQVMKGEKS